MWYNWFDKPGPILLILKLIKDGSKHSTEPQVIGQIKCESRQLMFLWYCFQPFSHTFYSKYMVYNWFQHLQDKVFASLDLFYGSYTLHAFRESFPFFYPGSKLVLHGKCSVTVSHYHISHRFIHLCKCCGRRVMGSGAKFWLTQA